MNIVTGVKLAWLAASGENGRMKAEFICHTWSEAVTLVSVALLNKKSLAAP